MPDLTIEHRYVCPSVLSWHKRIQGSRGNAYEVRYGFMPNGDYEYGWSCTCLAFKFRGGECKHIAAVKHERCAWGEDAFCGGGSSHQPRGGKCPNCGEELEIIRVGV